MSRPNIYVATAYCGENEFDDCLQAVNNQKGVKVSHSIIYNMPILEAFEHMYSSWTHVKSNFDLFVQVDADIVLMHDHVIIDIYNKIKDTKYNVISYPVFDHITNTKIWALNSYKNSVIFPKLKNKYKPDMEFTGAIRYPTTLQDEAMANHAPNPSPKHAFHFGWHRELRVEASPGQQRILDNLVKSPLSESSKHAIEGMRCAQMWKRIHKDTTPIEYTNPIFEEQYAKYSRTI